MTPEQELEWARVVIEMDAEPDNIGRAAKIVLNRLDVTRRPARLAEAERLLVAAQISLTGYRNELALQIANFLNRAPDNGTAPENYRAVVTNDPRSEDNGSLIDAIANSKMDSRHDHLNALLEPTDNGTLPNPLPEPTGGLSQESPLSGSGAGARPAVSAAACPKCGCTFLCSC